jgi:formylglycine-generating enzyme required for sulfatase activity
MRTVSLTLLVGGVFALLAAPAGACPPDAVQVGPTCVDRYEASVWSIPAAKTKLIAKVKAGHATLADLTNGGATQLGAASTSSCSGSEYGPDFPVTGNWTAPLYAVSIPDVLPSACLTWFQAEQAGALSGKRLLTNQEWQRAAAGTPDPGTDNGTADCNISAPGSPVNTGSRSACVSNWGARDMVGNVWEWVGNWGDLATGCTNWTATFGTDYSCIGDGTATGATLPGALLRGGDWSNGAGAGVFAVAGSNDPSAAHNSCGLVFARADGSARLRSCRRLLKLWSGQ